MRLPFVDLHCDVVNNYMAPVQFLASGIRTATPYAFDLAGNHGQGDLFAVDLPGMRAAGMLACVASIHCPHVYDGLPLARVLSQLMRFREQVEATGGIRLIEDTAGLDAALAAGEVAVVLGVENADLLCRDLYILDALHHLGFRAFTPAWYGRNCVCDAGHESPNVGLSWFGKKAVERMARLGMLVDVSHMNPAGARQCLEIAAETGVFASHADCAALRQSTRNVTDDLLSAIARAGGLLGVCLLPRHLTEAGTARAADVAAHVAHAVEVMGEEAVAVGSDYDGTTARVEGLERLVDLPALWPHLAAAGLSPSAVEKVAWRNALAFLRRHL